MSGYCTQKFFCHSVLIQTIQMASDVCICFPLQALIASPDSLNELGIQMAAALGVSLHSHSSKHNFLIDYVAV